MKNLINFFFSFEKLFKEKLIVPFFWLALIVWGLGFFETALDAIQLDPLAAVVEFIQYLASILLALVTIRLIAEAFVALFRINDNLSPDGGKSETADIDPVAEARRAAEMAAARTREMTKTATERTRSTFDDVKSTSGSSSSSSAMGKGSEPNPSDDPTPVKALEPSAIDKPAVKKRGPGRPKGSKNKPNTATAATATKRGPGRPKGSKNKTSAASAGSSSTKSKPGPKKGRKVPRDKDGNLLKKDGTPRKKPGPKPKS